MMHRAGPSPREQRTTVVYGMLASCSSLVVLQLWLLTATMNAYLGGDDAVIWPAARRARSACCSTLGLLALSVPARASAGVTAGPTAPPSQLAGLHPAYFAHGDGDRASCRSRAQLLGLPADRARRSSRSNVVFYRRLW